MNKQTYITPAMEIMNIETVEMMAQSPVTFGLNDSEVNTESDQLAGGRRGSWGNLWGGE